jgi:photosystem II stability/assembly factor-like uncharacterized protein
MSLDDVRAALAQAAAAVPGRENEGDAMAVVRAARRRRRTGWGATVASVAAVAIVVGAITLAASSSSGRSGQVIIKPEVTTSTAPAPTTTVPRPAIGGDSSISETGPMGPNTIWGMDGSALYRLEGDGTQSADITPPGIYDPVGHVDFVSFTDVNHGWVAVSQNDQPFSIFRTADAGVTWTRLHPTDFCEGAQRYASRCGEYVGMTFLDATRGWNEYATSSGSGLLMTTVDGGLKWTKVGTTPGAGPIHFENANDGWMVRSPGLLYQTEDGGRRWTLARLDGNQTSNVRMSVIDYAMPEFFGKTGIVFGSTRAAVNGVFTSVVATTADGGLTWKSRPVPRNVLSGVVFNPGLPVAFTAASPSTYFFAAGGRLWQTQDSGQSWYVEPAFMGFTQILGIVATSATDVWLDVVTPPCPDAASCVSGVLGQATVAVHHSSDGGKTWTVATPKPNGQPVIR